MEKFVISLHADHVHVINVGVIAEDAEIAKEMAISAYRDGTVWDNTQAMPLLYDDSYDADKPRLTVSEAEAVDEFPEADDTVLAGQRREMAFAACMNLIAGNAHLALELARLAVPGHTVGCHGDVDTTGLLALADTGVVEASLTLQGGLRSTHFVSVSKEGVVLDEGCDGEIRQIDTEQFLADYPPEKGRIWIVGQVIPKD